MAVIIDSVQRGSPAYKAGFKAGETLVTLNGHQIMDVLDYRFYQDEQRLEAQVLSETGKKRLLHVSKREYEDLGLDFATYLMDKQRSCKNKCVFCFIDQLPAGLRDSLYFKDDDSRLSFLFGNYITLTNITEHEVERIIHMHISPINISVHTTNPALRVKMMNNRFAGEKLEILYRLADAGIAINCQLVLCPGWNDGAEQERTLRDLTALESVNCIAAVPVGLTKYRQGLTPLTLFDPVSAAAVIDCIDRFGEDCLEKTGSRRVYAADEFYLIAGREMPEAAFYEDFALLENGVGLWALLKSEAADAVTDEPAPQSSRRVSLATGASAAPLMRELVDMAAAKWHNLDGRVYPIVNDFFGHTINVAGLVTGGDLIRQLKDKPLGDELLIPSVMLRHEGDLFLDDVSLNDVERELGVPVRPVPNDGYALMAALAGN
ncbi:MAG: DUF512 domain-containing protein [Clostridiales bacterium]|nr:DUF512 domain-containing protein [Clostridiales bacterium]